MIKKDILTKEQARVRRALENKFMPVQLSKRKLGRIFRWLIDQGTDQEYPQLDRDKLIENLFRQAVFHRRFSRIVINHVVIKEFISMCSEEEISSSKILTLWKKIKGKKVIIEELNFYKHSPSNLTVKNNIKKDVESSEKNIERARLNSQKADIIYNVLNILRADFELFKIDEHQFGVKSNCLPIDKLKGQLAILLRNSQSEKSLKVMLPDAVKLVLWCNPNPKAKKYSEKTIDRYRKYLM